MCLSLLVNAVIAWNTMYLELALAEYVRLHGPTARFPRRSWRTCSPALLEHVNQYGTYDFPIEKVYAHRGYRPLRLAELAGQLVVRA